jgi:glycosyltransferase involved in cell wall biosynthesis
VFDVPVPRLKHVHPWLISRQSRLAMFYRRPRRVAYYADTPNDSSFRFRVYAMATALNEADTDVSASWFYRADRHVLEDVFTHADVVVVHRSEYAAELDHVIGLARRKGISVFYDCDDLVFDESAVPLIMRTLAQPLSHKATGVDLWAIWYAMISRLAATARLCDSFIGTTDALAEQARAILGVPTSVIPNFMTEEELDYSTAVIQARDSVGRRRDGRLHLGYFSGSPSHVNDIAIAGEGLRAVLIRHPEVMVRIAGFMSIKEAGLERFKDRVDVVPFTDYVNLHRVIGETEVNIAPLQDNRFTRCKSELKWFDAGVVGIPTLASPTESMAAAVQDGVDAMLVADYEWEDALEAVISDYDGLGRRIGERARQSALERYHAAAVVGRVLTTLGLS